MSLAKPNPAASGSASRVHDQLNKKISRARLGSKVLQNLVTPGGAELGPMAKFVKALNDADCPDGPTYTAECMKGMEESLSEFWAHLEVTITHLASLLLMIIIVHPPVPEIWVELPILLGVEK